MLGSASLTCVAIGCADTFAATPGSPAALTSFWSNAGGNNQFSQEGLAPEELILNLY